MTWLNNGSILQIENENDEKLVSVVLKEYDEEFVKLAIDYGKIFNILLENPLKANEACDNYSNFFKDLHTETSDFCYICFIIIKLCFFTPLHKNIRSQVIELSKYIRLPQDNDILIELLFNLFQNESIIFHDKYIKNGGTESICNQITQYNEADTTEKWISQIHQIFQISSSEFDRKFCKFIDQEIIQCENYLLSVLLTNFLSNKKTTPHNLLDTGSKIQIHFYETTSLVNKVFYGFFNKEFANSCKYLYPASNDTIFAVHFVHLLSLIDEKKDQILEKELDSAILRYTEIILSDYDDDQDTGLRKWIPSYLNVVGRSTYPAVQRILPAIKSGIQGSLIDNVLKLPQFVFTDNSENVSLFYDIEELVTKLDSFETDSDENESSDENSVLEEIVRILNNSYIKCNDKMKSDILLKITPYLEKFDGLSGPVISSMIDIGNDYSTFKDNDPCPILQKMLYDIILETGDVPEFLIK